MVSTSSAPAPVVAVELALDLAAFETTVGVSLTGDLTGLLSTEADAVPTLESPEFWVACHFDEAVFRGFLSIPRILTELRSEYSE